MKKWHNPTKGIKVFVDDNSGKAKRVIVQVKSGHVKSGDIRDLVGTLDREGGAIGVFITWEDSRAGFPQGGVIDRAEGLSGRHHADSRPGNSQCI